MNIYQVDKLDRPRKTWVILLDLSAAFDTVNHQLLISTLTEMGISGTALSWIASFLADRSYQVAWRGSVSAPHPCSQESHYYADDTHFSCLSLPLPHRLNKENNMIDVIAESIDVTGNMTTEGDSFFFVTVPS